MFELWQYNDLKHFLRAVALGDTRLKRAVWGEEVRVLDEGRGSTADSPLIWFAAYDPAPSFDGVNHYTTWSLQVGVEVTTGRNQSDEEDALGLALEILRDFTLKLRSDRQQPQFPFPSIFRIPDNIPFREIYREKNANMWGWECQFTVQVDSPCLSPAGAANNRLVRMVQLNPGFPGPAHLIVDGAGFVEPYEQGNAEGGADAMRKLARKIEAYYPSMVAQADGLILTLGGFGTQLQSPSVNLRYFPTGDALDQPPA